MALLGGCGGNQAKTPNPTRPLDERRAIEVIRQAVIAESAEPAPPREVTLVNGSVLRVDVSIQNKEFGIAYITVNDAQKLGNNIPPPNKKDERLRLARAGDEGEVRIVLLYQENYLYDDLAGESHEQTAISAEKSLARDAQDFITHARTQKYK
jgi:hypothetical protein